MGESRKIRDLTPEFQSMVESFDATRASSRRLSLHCAALKPMRARADDDGASGPRPGAARRPCSMNCRSCNTRLPNGAKHVSALRAFCRKASGFIDRDRAASRRGKKKKAASGSVLSPSSHGPGSSASDVRASSSRTKSSCRSRRPLATQPARFHGRRRRRGRSRPRSVRRSPSSRPTFASR